jgi:hypothetical protein
LMSAIARLISVREVATRSRRRIDRRIWRKEPPNVRCSSGNGRYREGSGGSCVGSLRGRSGTALDRAAHRKYARASF